MDRFVSEKREGLDRGHIITEKFFADDDIAFGALIAVNIGVLISHTVIEALGEEVTAGSACRNGRECDDRRAECKRREFLD